jgi:hypothetical protein
MSKLREYLEATEANYKTCDANTDAYHDGASATADKALALLAAHDAEIIEQAKREQMEEDCAAVCLQCRHPEREYNGHSEWCEAIRGENQ